MAKEPPPLCSACEQPVGRPEDEIAHPDDDNPPENPHFKIQIRKDGEERMQCTESGKLAKVITPNDEEHPANKEAGQGGVGSEGEPSQPDRGRQGQNQVYDVEEEKTQMDLLKEVVTNPHYGLDDEQIQEMASWAQDYDGQLPPDTLEQILKRFKGVQKQTAELMRNRYELKLNKWVQKQQQDDSGPPIGVPRPSPPSQSGMGPRPRPTNPTPNQPNNEQNQNQQEEVSLEDNEPEQRVGGIETGDLRERRRRRRVKRRNDTADIAAQQVAKEVAPEVARELTANFGQYFSLPAKIIEAKIEKDPDWAIEKAEQLDIDIFEFLEPSDRRKKELEEESQTQSQPEVDNEIDKALAEMDDSDNGGEPIEFDDPEESEDEDEKAEMLFDQEVLE